MFVKRSATQRKGLLVTWLALSRDFSPRGECVGRALAQQSCRFAEIVWAENADHVIAPIKPSGSETA